ncbi:hypothetical protein [Stutzerimonas nitrititolerans]|uniref:hypothetical protein n=1 Tax=Stutzerimonas nitrititolerans TaxID=2482751 RepID=UPI0028972026|nr:hypothetical protein [Stutzerimonas nitrititolerans]
MNLLNDLPEEHFEFNKLVTAQRLADAKSEPTAASIEAMPTQPLGHAQTDKRSDNGQNQASLLISFVTARFRLFHDHNQETFCQDKTTREVFALESRQFRDRVQASYYQANRHSLREQSIREALGTLAGLGRFQGPRLSVSLRTAAVNGNYYLDLATPGSSRAIRLQPGSWDFVEFPDATFIRPDSMQPLPEPVPGGSIDPLWRLANIPPNTRLLVLTWLIDSLRPDTPYPLLELIGEHGTAKSATQTALRRLLDPNICNLRGAPRSEEDTYVSARACALLSYENVSYLSASVQDALCVVATGGGYGKRKLYSDFDESVLTAKRPIILNGITASVTAQDLVDRAINIELPVIVERREITEIWREYEQYYPSLLGALLDIAAKALELLPTVQLPPKNRPRLLEYARLGMAVAQAMGEEPEAFLREFNASRHESLLRTIDASPVATAIQELTNDHPEGTTGSVKQLLSILGKYRLAGGDSWPGSPKGLGDAMRRAAPTLRQFGIRCECLGKGSGGVIRWAITRQATPTEDK